MFENIVGNNNIKNALTRTVELKNVSHSYIFDGIEGIGKRLIAKEFAKMIMCLDEKKYCNKCKSCIEFNSNNNPDFIFIEPEGNNIKIEQIRQMQSKVIEKPIISNKKVYIINDAQKMTVEAQNCLLKTLEEPPEYITIILIVSNDNNLLSTIKSRCTIIHFDKIENKELKEYATNIIGINNINENIINIFQGSIGKAIRLKDKLEVYGNIEKIMKNMTSNDIVDIIACSEILYKSKDEIEEILEYINVILLSLSKKNIKYIKCIEVVEDTKKRLKANSNYDMSIDNMLFSIWEEINEKYSRS